MKVSKKNKHVVRTTPRGTRVDTPVVVPAPRKKRKPTVKGVSICCANLDCNNRKSYRSPHQLCRYCRELEKSLHHTKMYFRAIHQPYWTTGYPVPKIGGPYWSFYIAPFLRKCVENSRQEPDASYVPLYAGTE